MADIDRNGNKNFTVGIMKTNCWLILGTLIAASAIAQNNTNALPPIPAPIVSPTAETAPAPAAPATVKHKKHAAPKRAALDEPTVTLVPGAAEVAVANLNVRGQAGLKGEAVAHLNKGDAVTVLSQINLDKHAVGEPAQWAKIALPTNTHVWVNTKFIDADSKTVSARKLNLRAGPGENYSILGVIERGTTVNEITTKDSWTQIEPPTDAYAFVAAMYLKQEASGNLAANPAPSTETTPAPTTNTVAETQPIVAEPTNAAPAAAEVNSATPNSAPPTMAENNAATVVDTNPPPPRVVTHEGVVGPVGSIIAPTAYVLYDPSTRQNINFLYTTSTNLDIGRYNGMLIDVTGEEGIAERWPDTPLLTIQRIIVIETNAIPKVYYPSPRQRG
jgi:uncharacterized protein YgiM (DUF1202 family)